MTETDRSESIIHLIEQALGVGREGRCSILTPAGESREPLPQEAFDFVDEAFQENARDKSLPALGPGYVDGIRDLVQSAESNCFCIIPSFRTLRLQTAEEEPSPEEIEAVEDLRDSFGDTNLSTVALLTVLDALPNEGKAVFILPDNFSISKRAESFRKETLEKAHPELIIQPNSHPFGDAIHPQFRVHAILFSKARPGPEKTPVTKFFEVPDRSRAEWNEVADDFGRLMHQGGGETEFGYVLRHRLDPGEPWNYESLHPGLEREIDDVRRVGQVKPLVDSFEVVSGLSLSSREDLQQDENSGDIPVIEARDIRPDGKIQHEDSRFELREKDIEREQCILREGDLCMRAFWLPTEGLIVGKVEDSATPSVAGHGVVIVRPRDGVTEEDLLVLNQYLQSETAGRYFRAKNPGATSILVSNLKQLPVPEADDSLRSALRGLIDAASRFEEWGREAREAAQSLFDFPSAGDGRMHVLTTGRRTRQRQQAAKRVDELSHRVQTQFPHPIAYRWRTVAASKPDLYGYRNVLGCAEVTLCYLALVAIKMVQVSGERIGYLESMGNRIVEEGRGVNMGDWVAILREVRESKALADLPDTAAFYDVMHFMPEESDADDAVMRLKNRRDDHSHEWKPQDSNPSKEDFKDAKSDLLELLSAAEFVTEYPLRYITRTEIDTLESTVTYRYQDVMGDHPLVPTEQATIEKRPLEADSLYLVDRSGDLHLLRPLLNRRRCPECGAWSTFHLNGYYGGNTCSLKSMERSHEKKEDLYPAFQKVGFLP
jgi:hypothetical protein